MEGIQFIKIQPIVIYEIKYLRMCILNNYGAEKTYLN